MSRVLLFLLLMLHEAGAAVIYGPVPYRGRLDSPFLEGIRTGDILVEDFEDGLNTPGLSVIGGAIDTGASPDEDDGILNGRSPTVYWRNDSYWGIGGSVWRFDIRFPVNGDGTLPFYAGLALLGGAYPDQVLTHFTLFRAYDGNGQLLTPEDVRINDIVLPYSTPSFSSLGVQFFGLYSEKGISRILIGQKQSIDHIQYGWAIPEPGSGALLLAAGALAAGRRAAAGTRLA